MSLVENKNIIALILILIIGISVYANALQNPFIWDDEGSVLNNHLIRDLKNLPKLFQTDLYHGSSGIDTYYRPIQTLSYLWDFQLWKLNPFGYHLTSILLHIFNACLIYLLILQFCKEKPIALLTALLFVSHPVSTEAVTYISGRADPLVFLFILLSIILFINSTKLENFSISGKYLGSLACFALALLTKEIALILPILLILIDFCFSERFEFSRKVFIKRYVFFFIVAALYLLLRFLALWKSGYSLGENTVGSSLYSNLLTFSYVLCRYISLLILPLGLHMRRAVDPILSFFDISVISSIVAVALIFFLIIYSYKKNRFIFFCAMWFFITLLPQSNLFPINSNMAEHFLYLPSMGFFAIIAFFICKALTRKRLFVISSVLIIIYSCLTIKQNTTWKNPIAFYKRILYYEPFSFLAHNNLGNQYQNHGQIKLAQVQYYQAYAIYPEAFPVLSSLARYYVATGDFDKALKFFDQIKKLYPEVKNDGLYNNIGIAYLNQRKTTLAIEKFKTAIEINPNNSNAFIGLASAFILEKKYEESRKAFYNSLGVSPKHLNSLISIEKYREIYRLDSPPEKIYTDIGIFSADHHQFDLARLCFEKAISFSPDKPEPYYNLGALNFRLGNGKNAEKLFKTSLKKNPQHEPSKKALFLLKNK